MSFLSQLRQAQPQTQQHGLQLCYQLRGDPRGRLVVSLILVHLHRGQIASQGKPYVIQPQHLALPPPFLANGDVAILRALVAADASWQQTHQGHRLPEALSNFLAALIETGRCYVQIRPAVWRNVSLGQPIPSEPCWSVDPFGVQRLSWTCDHSYRLWTAATVPLWFSGVDLRLHLGEVGLSSQQSAELAEQAPLAPNDLPAFFKQRSARWRGLRLPLPVRLVQSVESAEVIPLLLCESRRNAAGEWFDDLVLAFRYIGPSMCMSRRFADADDLQVWSGGDELVVIDRHRETEQKCLQQIQNVLEGFTASREVGHWHGRDGGVWRALLLTQRRGLEALGFQLEFDSGFRYPFVHVQDWSVKVARSGAEHLQMALDVKVEGRSIDVFELLRDTRLFNRLHEAPTGEIDITLADGRIVVLPAKLLVSLADELGDLLGQGYRGGDLPLNQLCRFEQLKQTLPEGTQWHGDQVLVEQSVSLHSSPIMLDRNSSGVQAQLRPYQWLGSCWIQHLRHCGFNGLLADDMGLGKTLQTLTHLSLEHQQQRLQQPALIIAPTSLLHNWANETRRFCPHLKALVIHGGQRHSQWQQVPQHQIVITSYPLLLRDVSQWRDQALSWLVLDEAQVIKNARTQISQAVKSLSCKRRLCLSGTPVENHLGELWSIMDFLMPGILGSHRQFREYYQKPIEVTGDGARLQQLLRRIAPFVMRRSKNQVARDLPPKTLITQKVPFCDRQRAFYEDLKMTGWQTLQQQLRDVDGEGQKHMLLLTALMKLRQACCDPALLADADIPSAKRQHCIEMLSELAAEGRSVLVFSQFTTMLDLLAGDLRAAGIDYLMLTGSTPKRAHLVEQFQAGAAPVFLISLKAGGVGLNLTRADTVIHYDPWWNLSAEQQASDRAHRIGQEQPVFVYKLIAEDTIEEKIAQMQENKAALGDYVNQQGQTTGKSFALKMEDLLELWCEE